MYTTTSSSRLPRAILQLAGQTTVELASFDPNDFDAMLRFFVRHGYLQRTVALFRPDGFDACGASLSQYRRTSKGDWLLQQLQR